MASSYENYLKQIRAANEKQLNEDIAASDAYYEGQKQIITDNYNQQIEDTTLGYEDELRRNEVQKLINERAVARRNAELGLTDSGLNRTGQLAVQLSYANNKGDIQMQRQKAVDTLAATMRAQITEMDLGKTTAAQNIKSTYEQNASKQATEMYKADVDAEATRVAAEIEATQKNAENRNKTKSTLIKALTSVDYSDAQKLQMIRDFWDEVGATESEIKSLLAYTTLTWEDLIGAPNLTQFLQSNVYGPQLPITPLSPTSTTPTNTQKKETKMPINTWITGF